MNHFALLADDTGIADVSDAGLGRPTAGGLLWEHYEGDEVEELARRLAGWGNIPQVAINALVASETRPRCDEILDGALINLRGLALDEEPRGDGLVSLRAWVLDNLVISVSRRRLAALPAVVERMRDGAITDAGDLVAAFARSISEGLDPQVADLGDDIDSCESEIEAGNVYRLRRQIAVSRSQAILYRRFIAPDRDALLALANLRMPWLSEEDRLHIREAADRFARMAEELEAVRERAALLHEELADLRAEMIDRRSLMIAVVAFIFLPLTFITGLLGMNVVGIPFADRPWAFWGVVAFCVGVGLIVFGWFAYRHWFDRDRL